MTSQILESIMILFFGLSWPLSIIRSWKARSTKGKSLFFLCAIELGYAAGLASKILMKNITYVFLFYVINFLLVGIDIALFFRNHQLES